MILLMFTYPYSLCSINMGIDCSHCWNWAAQRLSPLKDFVQAAKYVFLALRQSLNLLGSQNLAHVLAFSNRAFIFRGYQLKVLKQDLEYGDLNCVVFIIPRRSKDDSNCFNKLSSLPRVDEMDLICAVLSGRLDPSILKTPSVNKSGEEKRK
ncbi:hypothetical protein Pint_35985 [Pistacia integerrima]|uniref:Uncharacterized protein n=1 Tax=Pistacia integerrima TaxID=434235 RepID=A0ACC0Y1F3_9ROSI|nr:hypothetical protein Pint_35985 [Pistacia integerrima]